MLSDNCQNKNSQQIDDKDHQRPGDNIVEAQWVLTFFSKCRILNNQKMLEFLILASPDTESFNKVTVEYGEIELEAAKLSLFPNNLCL